MKKLLLSCELEYNEATGEVAATMRNEGVQRLVPLALANMAHNHLKDARKENREELAIGLLMSVLQYIKALDEIDMTIINISALEEMGGGGDA